MKKKLLSLFLALTMIVCSWGTIAFSAVAAEPEAEPEYWTDEGNYSTEWFGDGKSAEYTIENEKELAGMAVLAENGETFSEITIVVAKDLDLSGKRWEPIGGGYKYSIAFAGVFSGGDKTISGIEIDSPNYYDVGLFAAVAPEGVIKDLAVRGTVRTAYSANGSVGAIVGYNQGTILSCGSYADVKCDSRDGIAGGLVGFNEGKLVNCFSNASVTASDSSYSAGGILGNTTNGTMLNCYSAASISAGPDVQHGIVHGVGVFDTCSNCYYVGTAGTGIGQNEYLNAMNREPYTALCEDQAKAASGIKKNTEDTWKKIYGSQTEKMALVDALSSYVRDEKRVYGDNVMLDWCVTDGYPFIKATECDEHNWKFSCKKTDNKITIKANCNECYQKDSLDIWLEQNPELASSNAGPYYYSGEAYTVKLSKNSFVGLDIEVEYYDYDISEGQPPQTYTEFERFISTITDKKIDGEPVNVGKYMAVVDINYNGVDKNSKLEYFFLDDIEIMPLDLSIYPVVVELEGNVLYANGQPQKQLIKKIERAIFTVKETRDPESGIITTEYITNFSPLTTDDYYIKDNSDTNTDPGAYQMNIVFKGNYSGEMYKDYYILQKPDEDEEPVSDEKTVDIGFGQINIKVDSKDDAPKTSINMNTSDIQAAVTTANEMSDILNGRILNIWMEISEADNLDEITRAKINSAIEDYEVECYLDIDLFKQFTDETEPTNIVNTNGPMTIGIIVPEELREEGATYAVIRYHDGKPTLILPESYNPETGELVFKSDSFSIYTLVKHTVNSKKCCYDKQVHLRSGELKMYLGRNNIGTFTFDSNKHGWSIFDNNNGYVSFDLELKKVVYSKKPYYWEFDKGFYTTVISTESKRGRNRKVYTDYYLTSEDNELSISLKPVRLTLTKHIETDEHDCTCVKCDEEGHTVVCKHCGFETYESHKFVRGKCMHCGYYEKAKVIAVDVKIKAEKSYRRHAQNKTKYFIKLHVNTEGRDVRKIEYSVDNIRWERDDSFVSYKEIKELYIRVIDANGDVSYWYYDGQSTSQALL